MSEAASGLIRVVYFSLNSIEAPAEGMAAELEQILAVAQARNASNRVTGALMFNSGVFAQVLEGPAAAVEETFDRIQSDRRHYEVTVLEIRSIAERSFRTWSMGFVGCNARDAGHFERVGLASGFDAERLTGEEICRTLCDLARRHELRGSVAA